MNISRLKMTGSELEQGLFGASPWKIEMVLQVKSFLHDFTFQTRSLPPDVHTVYGVDPFRLPSRDPRWPLTSL